MLLSMTKNIQKAKFFRNLGQLISSITKSLARAPFSSTSEKPFEYIGINFTGCKVVLHSLGSKRPSLPGFVVGTNINQGAYVSCR